VNQKRCVEIRQWRTWLAWFPLDPPTTTLTWFRCWLSVVTAGHAISESSALNASWNGMFTLLGTAPRLYLTRTVKFRWYVTTRTTLSYVQQNDLGRRYSWCEYSVSLETLKHSWNVMVYVYLLALPCLSPSLPKAGGEKRQHDISQSRHNSVVS